MEPINLQTIAENFQSIIGLIIQCAGIFLVASLTFFMTRSIRRTFLLYWATGWVFLASALLSLIIGFRFGQIRSELYTAYFLAEYAFGFLLVAGCRNFATGATITRSDLRLLAFFIIIAAALPHLSDDFDKIFILHTAILAVFFVWSFTSLQPARRRSKPGPGLRVISAALVLLSLDFAHYVPVMSYIEFFNETIKFPYLQYTSIYDLILEILLAFGMVMVVMEDLRHEVEEANRELIAARDRLEVLARIDPLTEALNRHAFHSLLEKRQEMPAGSLSGCAVVIDIDNLKPINDRLGHTAGDAAIREVARCLRAVIRADDLLFRWGGDEFLILLFNITEAETRRRIDDLDTALTETRLPGSADAVPLIVSYGLSPFKDMSQIEQAIERADEAMYARKQSRKNA
ncbi:MAG TPA: GGDEF domain-containing protein [Blastocatellia bacterium]|nr:GGDEF domain-containing protein [Blastocatellia bacterium]